MPNDAAHLAKALALAKKIEAKAEEILAPMDLEMRMMKWPADYRRIVWEEIGRKALRRAGHA